MNKLQLRGWGKEITSTPSSFNTSCDPESPNRAVGSMKSQLSIYIGEDEVQLSVYIGNHSCRTPYHLLK